jgi:hypothetical protein
MSKVLVVEKHTVVKKQKPIKVTIDGKRVSVYVDEQTFTNFVNQFKANTKDQKDRKSTLMKIVTAAYKQGFNKGQKATSE